ncbi:nucleotidyltransferase family protein [Yoonia sp. I 8.24]|uniref:nucleotidyltransferase family protein n=1 Tax=Yoonia sp. I 8.24 TaxID=1537229 RepID=UPI001EDD2738|nr:nucleotidyltransferase family protein [Yoonia sp. I 8.24]MCG3267388.1 nucleotidyltransferase family protein [Yoonia sp. I 8.24]
MNSFPSRRFPNFAWAWPDGGRLQLLQAALNPDEDIALQALSTWLSQNDLDDASFPEHRLFAAITTRFGRKLEGLAEYPRLVGLLRLHWTQSRLAVSANLPPVRKFVEMGLKPVLLKGAARVALDPTQQKSRSAFDLDLVMPDADFETAVCMLLDDGWQSTRGESALGLRARLSSVRARNFKKGRFGDIDLHRCAYQNIQANARFDAELLRDALPVTYYDLPVFVPSVEERLVMAMGHGAWDGHHHSDWLVDIAGMLNSETVDWDKLYAIARGRNLRGPIAIALSFLATEINIPLPDDVLRRFGAHTSRARLRDIPSLILARDTQNLSAFQTRVRAIVHGASRLGRSGRDAKRDTRQLRRFTRPAQVSDPSPSVFSHVSAQPQSIAPGTWTLKAKLLFKMPAVRRRIELEINGPDRNLGHVQVLHLRKSAGTFVAQFSIKLELEETDFPISLVSLNSKYVEAEPDAPERIKYDRLPFVPLLLELNQG